MPRGAASQPAEVKLSVDASDFSRLLGKSSEVQPKLRAALRKRIREAAEAAANDARRQVWGEPGTRSAHPRHVGLRDGIAAGIKVTVMTNGARAGVTIRSLGTSVPRPDQRSLVRAWESAKGWRHPVFGDREAWATQKGRPYFRRTIGEHRPQVQAAVEQAMRDAVDGLA